MEDLSRELVSGLKYFSLADLKLVNFGCDFAVF